ncbi:MAG: TonB-dependent siderophore receptor [Pseudomonadota bacterium]
MTHRRLEFFTATALTLTLATAPALAQVSEDSDGEDRPEEIVVRSQVLYSDQVNALKTPTLIIDVPQSLSITTADQIIQQGFDSLGDIVLYTPGVNNSQGEGHRDAIVFRGVRSTADFYVDGVRDDVQYYRGLYNLEQVEILRGPNALLFGRGGTGGILNRVTKKGVLGEQFVGYRGSVDTFGAFDAWVDVNVATTGNSALRINAAYENLNNHRDFYDGDRYGINPTFRVALSPATTVDISYEYINHERFIDRGIPSGDDGLPVDALQDITFADPENNFTTLEAHVFRATVQHEFLDNLKGNFSIFYGDYDKVYSNFFPVGYDPSTNIVTLDGYIDTTQRENFVLSGNLVGEFETGPLRHTIVGGAEYIATTNNNDRFNSFFDTAAADGRRTDQENFLAIRPINLINNVGVNANGDVTTNSFTTVLNDDTEADIDVFSIYIQDEIEVTDWLNIVLGGRFDSFQIEVDNIETFIDTGVRDIRERTDDEFSPRVGLIVKPMENLSLYGSYSESFLPRSGEQFADINPPDDALDPNTFTNLELGVKWDVQPGLSITGAIFQVEQDSPQVSDDNPDTLDVIETKVQGIELQVQGQVKPWWFVSAGYSFLDGEQADDTLRPRELPKHMFSIWNNVQPTDRFGLGIGLTYQSESFADNGNNVTLPSYTRVDVAAYYDVSERVRVQVNIENLFDELYFPNAHTADNITVAPPINARFTVSGRF